MPVSTPLPQPAHEWDPMGEDTDAATVAAHTAQPEDESPHGDGPENLNGGYDIDRIAPLDPKDEGAL